MDEEYAAVIVKKQDYALQLFNIARTDDGEYTYAIERAWAMDVAGYIVGLENVVRKFNLAQYTKG